jgi:predicted metal-dependent hydrolase
MCPVCGRWLPHTAKAFYDLLSRIMPDWEYRREKMEEFDFG